jgi:sulfate/thiosulfate-binding protein
MDPQAGWARIGLRRSGTGWRCVRCAALAAATMLGVAASACSTPSSPGTAAADVNLTLAAYTTPREAYAKIIPLFVADWKAKTGQTVHFDESYLGSGAQSRAVVGGFEADVVALSLAADVDRIKDAGLITHDWTDAPYNGMVSTSIAVIAVRAGDPLGIKDWVDLAKPGLAILTPDPQTSGGAQWNVLAMYGAAERGHVPGYPATDQGARDFLTAVFRNVTVLDKGARESITNFEKGVGDAAITYENEVLVGRQSGQTYEYEIPSSTILIENPAAVVDVYVDRHGTRTAAEAFVEFLRSAEAQRVYAAYGLRPLDPAVAAEVGDQYPDVQDLFTIAQFGGWPAVTDGFFGGNGIYASVMAEVEAGR